MVRERLLRFRVVRILFMFGCWLLGKRRVERWGYDSGGGGGGSLLSVMVERKTVLSCLINYSLVQVFDICRWFGLRYMPMLMISIPFYGLLQRLLATMPIKFSGGIIEAKSTPGSSIMFQLLQLCRLFVCRIKVAGGV